MRGISRRAFLILGGGATLGALAVSTGAILVRHDAGDVHARLSAFLSDHDGARALGRRYLAQEPQDAAALAAAIAPADTDARDWFDSARGDEFARHVRARVRADFERGDVVSVDGWQLAVTEARVCGLWSLV